jgi:IS6 family transposase
VTSRTRSRSWSPPTSAFAGFRFPLEVIVVPVRWYLRYNLSYRDIEERGANTQRAIAVFTELTCAI